MGRYTGPVERLSRREGVELLLEGGGPVSATAAAALELTSAVAPWLEVDPDRLEGRVLRMPARAEIAAPVDDHLVIEFYAR